MAKKGDGSTGFTVRFTNVGRHRLTWAEKISRPVTDRKLLRALERKRAFASRLIDLVWQDLDGNESDWGGYFVAGRGEAGRFLIVPGSEGMPLS